MPCSPWSGRSGFNEEKLYNGKDPREIHLHHRERIHGQGELLRLQKYWSDVVGRMSILVYLWPL